MKRNLIQLGIPIALAGTVIMIFVYGAIQQDLRQSANDPQIQLAEDAAAALSSGFPARSLFGSSTIDISKSLATFAIAYDDAGAVVGSSATLDGTVPALPKGVLDYVRSNGENRLTWQPAPGVRVAAVIVRSRGSTPGFFLVGRSLREVESRESQLGLIMGVGWVVLIVATFLSVVTVPLMRRRKEQGLL